MGPVLAFHVSTMSADIASNETRSQLKGEDQRRLARVYGEVNRATSFTNDPEVMGSLLRSVSDLRRLRRWKY